MNLNTGREKSHIVAKAVNILKEDRQAFGCLVGKSTSPQEAHSHPLTSVPLAMATPHRDLRQGFKACFRNFLIDESNSISESFPKGSNWFIDGMAVIKAVQPQTWGEYAAAF